jgi:fructokinase
MTDMTTMRFGIDLGGTKIEIIALDDEGHERQRRRMPTPQDGYDAIIAAIGGLVRAMDAECGGKGSVGIGIPGAISLKTGLVKNANTTALIGHPLNRDLSALLEREVRLDNDANCFALSEAVDGAAKGAGCVFGVIIGTGTGAGIALNSAVHRGRHVIAGEWGHNSLPWPTLDELTGASPCYCGQKGCIETWVSGTGFAREFRHVTGRGLKAPEIIAAAAAGDVAAEAAYRRYADRLARSLAHVVNILDPDAIVLGGGMGQVRRLYDDLPALVTRHVFSDEFATPILPPVHGDSSGVRGAAWLWARDSRTGAAPAEPDPGSSA